MTGSLAPAPAQVWLPMPHCPRITSATRGLWCWKWEAQVCGPRTLEETGFYQDKWVLEGLGESGAKVRGLGEKAELAVPRGHGHREDHGRSPQPVFGDHEKALLERWEGKGQGA